MPHPTPRRRPHLDDATLEIVRATLWNAASQINHRILLDRPGRSLRAEMQSADPSRFYDTDFGAGSEWQACTDPQQERANELAAMCRAMELIRRGRYGFCDSCGSPVAVERLKRRPHLLCCDACEAALRARFADQVQ